MDVIQRIQQTVEENPIVLFMKGSPEAPQCGFSMHASRAVNACGKQFAHVDILAEPDVRQNLPNYSNWPTFPQLFIKGELVGGCDIVMEMSQNGELKEMIDNSGAEDL